MSGRFGTIFFEQQFFGARQQERAGFRFDFFAESRIVTPLVAADPSSFA